MLGVLVVSGEYATGMIRTSLMAVPQRLPVLWAKLAVFCSVTFALMLWFALTAFFGVQAIVASHGVDRSLGDPDALRVVVGTALYLTAIGALGVGLGTLLRNTAAAISALVALLFVLPGVMALLPGDLGASIGPYLPLQRRLGDRDGGRRRPRPAGPVDGLRRLVRLRRGTGRAGRVAPGARRRVNYVVLRRFWNTARPRGERR